jgi:ATP-binding cassette subfamily B protein
VPILFGVFFPESDVQTQAGSEAARNIAQLRAELAPRPLPRAAERHSAPHGHIRFEDVHFHYPHSDREILSGLRLDLWAGTSTAIVGLNGAGKTTLIKLLARLYEPTAGRITVGGVDLRDVDPDVWRRELAVVFQDYLRYELDLGTNIRLGAPHRSAGETELRQALRWADAEDLETTLPAGFGTRLSSRFAEGVDLSGGQWQRVGLARAGYAVAGGASALVLDEPTAQLDARAEVAFFDRFLELTSGLTTVVVSHRFSTVRRADRIVVLAHGRIAEEGSHAGLLDRNGSYATLFRRQAERFQDPPVRLP